MEVDGTTWRTARAVTRPADIGPFGIYSLSTQTGTMAAGIVANSEVFQFRWTEATRVAAIWEIFIANAGSIVAFAAGITRFSVWYGRSWSANGTGGSQATMTLNVNKHRTAYGTLLPFDIRTATTAALGAGTKTLDAIAFGQAVSSVPATSAGSPLLPYGTILFAAQTSTGSGPIVLTRNEGFTIRAQVPITGTWTAGFGVRWSEMTTY